MSARDVIVKWWLGSNGIEGSLPRWTSAAIENTDSILSALDAAGYAVVPKSLLAKLPSDPPMSGLPKVDLTKVDFTAAKETP